MTVPRSAPFQSINTYHRTEHITAKGIARLPEEKRSPIEEWRRKVERHEEFAVCGSTNAFRYNEEISRLVLSCLRNLPDGQESGCRGYVVSVPVDG